jgi:GT2 family glycosyltransferase
MDVSIILVNYNTKDLIINCINSIKEHTIGLSYEIIIVDNGSKDGSKDFFSKQKDITYLYQTNNIGFGQANNLGARFARGKYLFLLNSDTILINNAIKVLYQFITTHGKTTGIVGGILTDTNNQENGSFGYFPTMKDSMLKLIKKGRSNLKYSKKQLLDLTHKGFCEVDYVLGADMMISKHLFENLQGFDPAFFMYYEESDLQKRSSNKGYKNYIIKTAQIHHLVNASVNQLPTNKKRIMVNKSMFIYLKKHHLHILYIIFKFTFCALEFFKAFTGKYTIKENIEYLKTIARI